MNDSALDHLQQRVLVTDFDGTMTLVDIYEVILRGLPNGEVPESWTRLLNGEITHVEGLRGVFARGPQTLAETPALLAGAELDPQIPHQVRELKVAGWDVVVVSAGSEWYIRELLSAVRDDVRIIANPGDFVPGVGLTMTWPPEDSLWYSAHFGVDKRKIVEHLQQRGHTVAFAGDGRPDLAAMRVIPAEYRFARTWLADELTRENLTFHRFDHWHEVAQALLAKD